VLRAYAPLLDLPGAFVFGSNDYFGPVLKNPFGYLRRERRHVEGPPFPAGRPARRGWSPPAGRI
jgi:hypothetical protein